LIDVYVIIITFTASGASTHEIQFELMLWF